MARKLTQRILDHMARPGYRPKKARALAREMGIAEGEYGDFRQTIKALRAAGRLVLGRGNAVLLPEGGTQVIGQYRANPRGFGFITPEAPSTHGDLFVPAGAALDAVTGDTVMTRVTKAGKRSGQMVYRARVVRVLARGHNRFVGELHKADGGWYVRPEGNILHVPILVADARAAGARRGDQVVVEIVTYPSADTPAQGVITEVLGPRGKPGVDVLTVLRQYGLPDVFDEAALEAARRIVDEFDVEAVLGDREDLRDLTVITIDPQDARDFDDAISLQMKSDGLFELGVHIADVSAFVAENSRLDDEARRRGNSVYLPRFVVPMLPELLSNGLCSLQEGQPRLTKSAFIRYDRKGRRRSVRLANSVIRSTARLSYEEAALILDGRTGGFKKPVVSLLRQMEELARIIQRRRLTDGMLVLDLPEVELVFDDEGKVIDAEPADDSFGHTIIEMFMVEANEAVAETLYESGAAALRRIHPEPDAAGAGGLARYLRLLGHDVSMAPERDDLQRLLDEVRGTPHAFAVNLAILRSLQQATYSPELVGHYALASEHYLHFTSPIRRYPDLTAHRLVERYLRGELKKKRRRRQAVEDEELIELGRHCSFTERRAADAERELTQIKVLELLSERLGDKVRGVVTGVAQFGVFVQLERFLIDGLIPVADLADDWWLLDQRAGCLIGEMSGKRIAIGDLVEVRISSVDVPARRLDLAYISHRSSPRPGAAGPKQPETRPKKRKRAPKAKSRRKKGTGHSKRRAR
ncbi:MAG: ribonuclease R [Phycisphaerales bacterium]|nr:MAG: ribonuclease R [Phycisphaerales bacterium]